tara:strand:+ start:2526 stop:2723 length:198 start_codon:yes stop_codon:yes gene_type:complete
MEMSRYTEYLKEKILCKVCDRIISRGHINNHMKSKIHFKNLKRENKDEEDEKATPQPKSFVINWD